MYGWASGQLGIPKDPKFHHLQDAAGSLSLKLRYRLSSFDTHASPRTLKQPVHHWDPRSEEHTSELQSLMRISYAVFCLKKKKTTTSHKYTNQLTKTSNI